MKENSVNVQGKLRVLSRISTCTLTLTKEE